MLPLSGDRVLSDAPIVLRKNRLANTLPPSLNRLRKRGRASASEQIEIVVARELPKLSDCHDDPIMDFVGRPLGVLFARPIFRGKWLAMSKESGDVMSDSSKYVI